MTKKVKLFWKIGNPQKNIECIPYADGQDYYAFVKSNYDKGYRQIIISSEIMVELIKEFALKGYTVTSIQFAEEDSDFDVEVRNILSQISVNQAFFIQLIDTLNFLAGSSSIEIQCIKLRGRLSDGTASSIFIQSNGIVGINPDALAQDSQNICAIVSRCLFG